MTSIIDLVRAEQTASTKSEGKGGDRPKTQFWGNVGMTLPGMGEDGSDMFISLPLGIPLDDLKPQKVSGNNVKWKQLVETKNALLAVVQSKCGELEPGQRVVIPGFTFEIVRVGEAVEPTSNGDNPLLQALVQNLR